MSLLNGQGHVTVSSSGHCVLLSMKLLLTIHQYLCNPTIYDCLVCFSANARVHLQNNTFILRKVVENLRDIDYQEYCEIVVSKEVCLDYV